MKNKRENNYFFKGDFYFLELSYVGGLEKVRWDKLFGIMGMTLFFFVNTMLIMLNFELARLAMINTGVVSVIWAISPFFSALLDFFINRQSLLVSQFIGMVFMLICAVLVGVKTIVNADDSIDESSPAWVAETDRIESWIPMVFALIVALAFSSDAMANKFCMNNLGLPPTDLGFLT